ncbi:hypothetical protein RPE78_09155 [Thioclava litoralis]|uniref:Uncharacterized protein n=1 Tax=Thioclava litoralis TaxID=3076557 RepID=A0ABZ1DYD5_9RHOB|nr:hypothetical protein RPE78_09155 [Thioclava sp. FTW29]
MRDLPAGFIAALQDAPEHGIEPVWFVTVEATDRDTGETVAFPFWTGSYDLPLDMPRVDGTIEARTHIGGCGLSVGSITYVADLTSKTVNVTMSQIADAAQSMLRGHIIKGAPVEIHVGLRSGGGMASMPVLMFAGIVDEAPLVTPAVGGEGSITLTIQSEIITQMRQINPAKSSDQHQKRRNSGDRFVEYASTVTSRQIKFNE